MSIVEAKCVSKEGDASQYQQNIGRRSFLITVDDNGKVEVSPSGQCEQVLGPKKMHTVSRKSSRRGKQRIRIAVVEEQAGSSDGELDNMGGTNDVMSINAQSLETMHDRFVKIYNKKLRGKPSFVVLEDALVRKRVEQTMQGPSRQTHAEQQTTLADVGAHMGSQTDEFLLQCAMRSSALSKGRSRGCQATDVSCKLPQCAHCGSAGHRTNTNEPLQRLSELCAVQLANKLKQASVAPPTGRSQTGTTPHVTISFLPAATEDASTQPQSLQEQQQQHQFLPATSLSHIYANCPHMLPAGSCNSCCKCCHCCQQLHQHQHQLQQQQQLYAYAQQQHPGTAAAYGRCCSSCCLLKPTMAQTMLGFSHAPFIPSHCSLHMLPAPDAFALQHRVQPAAGCTAPWQCYGTPPASMTTCNMPHCLHCQVQPHSCTALCNDCQQQQQQQQQQQELHQPYVCLCDRSCSDVKPSSTAEQQSSKCQLQCERSKKPREEVEHSAKNRQRKDLQRVVQGDIEVGIQAEDTQEKAGTELQGNASQMTVRDINPYSVKRRSVKKFGVQQLKERNKAGSSCPPGKVFMARFGRTCLILKPTTTSMPARLLTKRISRYTLRRSAMN